MSVRFTWLHLTDLHMGQAWGHLWPDMESDVLKDLRQLTERERPGPIEVVFFTGDLVQKGDPAEFERFEGTRKKILDALTVGTDPPVFLSVPGNHDLRRPTSEGVQALADLVVEDARVREEFWTEPDSTLRQNVDQALGSWSEWAAGLGDDDRVQKRDGLLPGDFVATVTLDNGRLGVVGLDTTFLQLKDGVEPGRLTLDGRQITALWPDGGDDWAEQHDATVLLTHHPPDWLDERGRDALLNQIAPAGRFTVHLFGHQHEERDLVTRTLGGRPRCELLGRSLFGLETFGDKNAGAERLHGFSAAVLTVRPGNATLRLWPREGVKQQNGGWELSPTQSLTLNPDEGTPPHEGLVGGWRTPDAPDSNGEAVQVREGATELLATAVEGVQREVELMSKWWDPAASPFPRKAELIERKLRRIRQPADRLVRDITEHVERNEPELGWRKYAKLRTEHLPRISNELLAVIGGLYFEERHHDLLPRSSDLSFSGVAKRLVDLLAVETGKPKAEILIVGEERHEPVGAEIIRLRFPACDLWNLPFAAHEYGYLVGQHDSPDGLADLKAEAKRAVDPESTPKEPPDFECYLPSVHRYRSRVLEEDSPLDSARFPADAEPSLEELQGLQVAQVARLFADAFATYFIGPAYVRALLLLRLRPDETLTVACGAMPSFTQRLVFALETLKWLRDNEVHIAEFDPSASKALAGACHELEKTWQDVLFDAGRKEDPYEQVRRTLQGSGGREGWLPRILAALEDPNMNMAREPVFYKQWEEACGLEEVLAGGAGEVPDEPNPWAVINAAWSLRWRRATALAALEARAIDLLSGRPSAKPPSATRLPSPGGRAADVPAKAGVGAGPDPGSTFQRDPERHARRGDLGRPS